MVINNASAKGFSLLELLLVLVIVGLIVSLAGLSVSSGSRPYVVEGSVRVFADVAEYAMDEAQLAGSDMGLLFRQQRGGKTDSYSYQWLQRQNTGWAPPLVDQDIFSARDFPPDVELRLEVEEGGTEITTDIGEAGAGPLRPQVVFYSSGETTPGILTLVDANNGRILWELEWDLLGRMTLKREGRDDDES
ncbi:MAG: GspH/FimT family pseudopilin [Gammaproteobacteria bacterium]|nr:GspH/FimT family pseudopilin [Gammaproteobacteria bacterium]